MWLALSILALLALAASPWLHKWRRGFSITRYDYLEVLSFDWKPGRQIGKEIQKRYDIYLGYGSLYSNLRRLVEEELIECRNLYDEDGLYREYRLTSDGLRWRNTKRSEVEEPFPTSLKPA